MTEASDFKTLEAFVAAVSMVRVSSAAGLLGACRPDAPRVHMLLTFVKCQFPLLGHNAACMDRSPQLCVLDCGIPRVTVRADKPSALVFADSSAVEVTRTAADFQ
jgi:hypothetical protein